MHSWLKSIRNPKEEDWDTAREYFEMLQEQSFDDNRRKSVNLRDRRHPTDEYDPERAAMILPLCHEAERLMEANLYRVLRGQGSDYVEILGWEKNDFPPAENATSLINYQQHYEIPTPELISDFINGSLIEGTGVMVQVWDEISNTRKMIVPDRRMIWFDQKSHVEECRTIVWRRHVSLGDLTRLRAAGAINYDDDSIKSVMGTRIGEEDDEYRDGEKNFKFNFDFENHNTDKINPLYREMTLDIVMDTEPWRWVYVVNERLVVAVTQPSIPASPQAHGGARFPITTFTPFRRKGEIDGDSMTLRLVDSQDFANSMIALLGQNIKNNVLGVPVTNQADMEGAQLEAGVWHYAPDPRGVSLLQFPNVVDPVINATEYVRGRIADPTAGMTPALRGQAAFSGMTATATRDLLNESQTRLSEAMDLGVYAMQSVYTIALILNQLYMQPNDAVRVLGDGELWRPMSGADLHGATGKDLVPSGFLGGKSQLTFETLNEAAVVMQTGGNPQDLMKMYFKSKYGRILDVDAIYPQNGIGNDPMQENANMKLGLPVSIDPDDMDQWHLQVHSTLQKDPEWLALVRQNPQVELQRQAHMQQHISRLIQLQAELGGAQVGLGGGIGAAGSNLQANGPKRATDGQREAQMRGQSGQRA